MAFHFVLFINVLIRKKKLWADHYMKPDRKVKITDTDNILDSERCFRIMIQPCLLYTSDAADE